MNERTYKGYLLFYRKINKKFFYVVFLTNENKIKKLLINRLDLPFVFLPGEKWIFFTKTQKNNFQTEQWIYGTKIETAMFEKEEWEWILSINHWIAQIHSERKTGINFFIFFQNLKNLYRQKNIYSELIFLKTALFFLKIIGQGLIFKVCASCQKRKIVGINLDVGGGLCEICKKEERIYFLDKEKINLLINLEKNQWEYLFFLNKKQFQSLLILNYLITQFIDERCGFFHKIHWKNKKEEKFIKAQAMKWKLKNKFPLKQKV